MKASKTARRADAGGAAPLIVAAWAAGRQPKPAAVQWTVSAVARWTDLPARAAKQWGRGSTGRHPGRFRVLHLLVLLGVLVWGGVPMLRGVAADVSRVRGAVRPVSMQAEAPVQTARASRPDYLLPANDPGGRVPGIPDVGEWADRVGVPVSAATPPARISSPFGPRVHPVWGDVRAHTGVDFAAALGTPVSATASGVVVAAGRRGGYGLCVEVRHPRSGLTTRYAHLSRIARGVRAGRPVRRGALVGFVGATGVVTGPHLHYEVRGPSGTPLDPAVLARRYQAAWSQARRDYDRPAAGARPIPPMRVPRG